MQLEASAFGHSLVLEKHAELGTIYADKDRIESVLINIVSNAFKYTPRGGEVVVVCAAVDEGIYISVRDNGVGVSAEDIPHLFDRFYRVDKARSRDMGGTGLGLPIAKEIVLAHGGDVGVDSEPGKGTTVRIYIPRRGVAGGG
jgi:two-component system sensor histidine kinase VicK